MSEEIEPLTPLTPLDNIVCDACFELNLTEDVHIQNCSSCGDAYCMHHTSLVNPGECSQCLHQVTVDIETIRRTDTHINPQTSKVTSRTRKARQIKIGGLHWLFVQRKIPTLSDTELELAIEYHRALYESLNYERDKRRAETFHRNAGKQVKFSSVTAATTTSSSVVVKKSRKLQAHDPAAVMAQALQMMQDLMKKQGMSAEQVKAMLLKK